MPVVHLDHLDIPVGVEDARDLLDHLLQQVDAERHVRGQHDRHPLRGAADGAHLVAVQPGRADHMRGAGLGREARMLRRRRWTGEIDHHIRLLEQGLRIVTDDDAEWLAAGQRAEIPSQHMRALAFGAADHKHAGGRHQQLQEHLPHAAGTAGDADANRAAAAAL